MTHDPIEPDARREELFIAGLLFGLTPDEQAEFDAQGAETPDEGLQSLADVIGRLDQARAVSQNIRLPAQLRERIRAEAIGVLRPTDSGPARESRALRVLALMPWGLAAACLLIAIATLMFYGPFRPFSDSEDPVRMRNRLLATAPDLIQADWSAGSTPIVGAVGDVAWSTSRQRGFMRFRGMRANDPRAEQYQLWIFDRNQDEKTPVDGGVFNINSSGEVVVPIRPALQVREPYLFAVTIEKPGGVVVSDRRRLPLLANVNP